MAAEREKYAIAFKQLIVYHWEEVVYNVHCE